MKCDSAVNVHCSIVFVLAIRAATMCIRRNRVENESCLSDRPSALLLIVTGKDVKLKLALESLQHLHYHLANARTSFHSLSSCPKSLLNLSTSVRVVFVAIGATGAIAAASRAAASFESLLIACQSWIVRLSSLVS